VASLDRAAALSSASLRLIRSRYVCTVFGLNCSSAPICCVVRPSPIRASTSSSRSVSAAMRRAGSSAAPATRCSSRASAIDSLTNTRPARTLRIACTTTRPASLLST
jgi:hypothetical protein